MYFWLWLIILIGSIILELATASALVSIWFSIGAVFGLILDQFNQPFIIQVIVFFIVSVLTLVIIRPLIKGYMRGNTIKTNADRVIGAHVKLLKNIDIDTLGEVKVLGLVWNATSNDGSKIEKDSLVEVLAIEGSKLIVKKI